MNWINKQIKDLKSLSTLEKRRLLWASILSVFFAWVVPALVISLVIGALMLVEWIA